MARNYHLNLQKEKHFCAHFAVASFRLIVWFRCTFNERILLEIFSSSELDVTKNILVRHRSTRTINWFALFGACA